MRHSSIATLCLLALSACPPPPRPPEDPHPPEPVVREDPIEGDPADIEGEELGEDHMDNAKLVEPGPAEAEVRTRESLEQPDD